MKTKQLLGSAALATMILIMGCKKDTFVEDIGECPIVLATNPANEAVNVPINQIVTVTFNKEMDSTTITATSVTLHSPTAQVVGVVTYSGVMATFTPSSLLTINTIYTGRVKTTVKDKKGNALQKEYVWTFTTGALASPIVVTTDPANLETNVPLNKIITATFSEPMNPLTISGASFTITTGGVPVTGIVTYAGNTATFTPTSNLTLGATYTGTITTGAENPGGTALASNYVWTFTTGAAIAPLVISTDPANLATNVLLNKIITATFNVPMDPTTISGTSFTITQSGLPVAGTVSYTGNTATFTPSGNLIAGTTYTATITTAAENLSGTPLASNYVWTFSTGAAIAPIVILTNPLNMATNVPLNQIITATFNGPMDPLTITGASFTITESGMPVAGLVSYSGNTATFTPSSNLDAGGTYIATITVAAQNLAGIPLASNYNWTFFTVVIPPTVISTDPFNTETNVALNKIISATFSVPMNSGTITGSSFTLTKAGVPVAGSVSYAGSTASFTPNVNLLSGSTYTATITNTVTNMAGTPMTSNYVWTFSTVAPLGPAGVDLNCVTNFAIIAGSTVENTGGTVVDGNLGLSPGTAVVGFPPGVVINGSIQINNSAANAAKLCLTAAYIDAAGRSLNVIVQPNGELGGLTLAPGLYQAPGGSFDITSVNLTLDGQGDANAVWIFQMPSSTLTVGNSVHVILTNGASAKNVYWQVGTSATIGTSAQMKGNILADQSITLQTGATLLGRALTRIAAITLDNNAVTLP